MCSRKRSFSVVETVISEGLTGSGEDNGAKRKGVSTNLERAAYDTVLMVLERLYGVF